MYIENKQLKEFVLLEDFVQQDFDAYLGDGCEWDARCNCEDGYDEAEDW